MRSRTPAALLLCGLLAAAAPGQTDPKDKDKEPPKGPTKLPEPKWPTEIGGRNLEKVLKDVVDPDPAVREFALRTLPGFGPDARKAASKLLLARMSAELDPGVRITVFNTAATLGLEKTEMPAAIQRLSTTVDQGYPGGLGRLHAVQTLGLLGPEGYPAITNLTGRALDDPSYETRRSIANTLGRVGYSETTGPNTKALNALAGVLAKDDSAAVRMEALQSLVILGPPWAGVKKSPDDKVFPPINTKDAAVVANFMRLRVGNPKTKTPGLEKDKQIEIWARVVLMRFDQSEINEGHLDAIAKHLDPKGDVGPKLQALQGLALFGEIAGKKIDDVVRVLDDKDPAVLSGALSALAAMGDKGKPAIPELEKLDQRLLKLKEERLKDEEVKKFVAGLKPDELKFFLENMPEEQMRKNVGEAIKYIKEAKPVSELKSSDPKKP